MLASFLGSWYGWLALLGAAYLLWAAVLDTGHRHFRAIKSRLSPEPPEPPKPPIVVMGAPSFSLSLTPLNERGLVQEKLLTRLNASFLIENKEALVTVTKLEAGVRRKADGREQRFGAFNAPALAPLHNAPVRGFEVDPAMFEGLVESDYEAAFVWWVRFTADGTRWEIGYDGETREYVEPRVVTAA